MENAPSLQVYCELAYMPRVMCYLKQVLVVITLCDVLLRPNKNK